MTDEELQARYREMLRRLIPPSQFVPLLDEELQAQYRAMLRRLNPPDLLPAARSDIRSLIATTLLYSAAIVAVVALMVVAIIVGVVMG